ncbi:MAG: hypothetical protein JXR76_31955 [Deltaproteobacteria bacterium]|nr:hypothetical protein [Deltaproteobacteria bacterium]
MHIMLRLFSFLLCVSIVFPVLAQTDLGALSYDKMLSDYAYPFKVHRHSFTSQGQSLEMAYMYLRDGDESPHTSANQKTGNRPVVLLLHGKNFNGAYWGQWNAAYQALTYPLIGWIQGPDADLMASVSARCYDMIFTQPVIEEFKNFKKQPGSGCCGADFVTPVQRSIRRQSANILLTGVTFKVTNEE